MELRHLRYFVAVADQLHFGRAAQKLHISQPPLSHQIQDLERELGVDLFHRTRHFVALTEAGRAFLEEARHILHDADHAMAVARRAGRGEIGRLSVGFGPAPESGVLRNILSAYLSRNPDVVLDLRELYTTGQIEALAARQIHVAFPLLPAPHRDLVVETIASDPLVAALPATHRLARLERISIADLRAESFIRVSPEQGTAFYALVQRACSEAGFSPRVAHEASHVITVLGFVAAGLGVAILPGSLRSRPVDGVVFRPIRLAPAIDIGVAYRRDDSSKLLLAFLEVVREVCPRRPRSHLRASASA